VVLLVKQKAFVCRVHVPENTIRASNKCLGDGGYTGVLQTILCTI